MGNTTGAVVAIALGIGLAYIVLSGKGIAFTNALQVYTGAATAVPNTTQQGGAATSTADASSRAMTAVKAALNNPLVIPTFTGAPVTVNAQ